MITNLKDKIKNLGCAIAIVLPFVALCLGIFGLSCYQIYKAEEAKSWMQVEAIVKKVEFKAHHGSGRNSGTTYETLVAYEYWINSKKHIGNKIAFGYSMSNVEDHDGVFATLDNAKKIMIYVNPDNADEAVIVTGINNSIIFVLQFAILFNSALIVIVLSYYFPKFKNYFGFSLGIIFSLIFYFIFSNKMKINIIDKIKVIEQVIPNDDDEIEEITIYSPNKN